MRYISALLMAICVGAFSASTRDAAAASPLRLEKKIPLPGSEGRLGKLTLDLAGRRLFVAAPVQGAVEVVDLQSGRRVQTLRGLQRPQGILYHAPSKRLFVATRGDASVTVFDGASLKQIARTTVPGGDPEALAATATPNQILVGYAAGSIGIMDPNGRITGDIRLDSHPEDLAVEARGTRMWINLPSTKSIAVADRAAKRLFRTWPVSLATSTGVNRAIAIDERNRRLFIATWRPPRLVALSSDSGVRIDERQTVADPETVSYDEANGRLYITGNDAVVDVVAQQSADRYEPLARIPTGPQARTSLFSPELNRLFVAVPKTGAAPAEIQVFEPSAAPARK